MPTPEFVLELRAKLGNHRLWLPGVTGVIRDDHGRVLLVRRADSGQWSLVSGILEPGEQPAIGLAREALEETGVEIRVDALAYTRSNTPVQYPNGDVSQYLDLTFVCSHVSGQAHVADEESTEVGWFHPERLPDDLSDTSRDRLAVALEFLADPGPGTRFVRAPTAQ